MNLKHYSQMLGPPKQIPLQLLLLYKATTCLMQPMTFILFPKWSFTIDFWLGSKSGSWQYSQKSSHLKDISSGL